MDNHLPANGRALKRDRGESAHHTSVKRLRKSRYRKLIRLLGICFIVCAVLLAALIIIKIRYVDIPDSTELIAELDDGTYFEGITVDGHDVSGLTYAQARELIVPELEAELRSINITVAHDTSLWLVSAHDAGVTTDLDTVLSQALALGRSDTDANNAEVKKALAETAQDFDVTLIPDSTALTALAEKINAAMGTEPIEPALETNPWASSPEFEFIDGVDGYLIDQNELIDDMTACIKKGDYTAVLEPELVIAPPKHTVEWLKENTAMRSTFQTSFRSARDENRVGNIQKATTILNGAKVDAGEQFDFNEYIGPRTEKGGWPLAKGIVNGNTYELQAGGGICQVSTTLYNALLCSGDQMRIDERHHHSWPSAYADYGLDSTVSTGGKNLIFTNTLESPIYIFAYCDRESYTMTIYIYGEPLPEGVTYKTRGETVETIEPEANKLTENPAWPTGYQKDTITSRKGYKAEAYRDKYVNGTLEGSELLYKDSYRAVQGETTVGTGDPSLPVPE